jgi:hypothetical protein
VQCDVRSATYESLDFLRSPSADVVGVYVCLDDDTLSLTAGRIIARACPANVLTVITRIRQENGLVPLLPPYPPPLDGRAVSVFRLMNATCTPEVVHGGASYETLARLIHEAYIDQQRSLGMTMVTNPSMTAWDRLADDLRESNRDQARHIAEKLAAIDRCYVASPEWEIMNEPFTDEEVEVLAIMEHERWVRERTRAGWTYGELKDIDRKISPYLVPWDKLPPPDDQGNDVRDYDRNTVRLLPEYLARAGFRILPCKGA